MISPISQESSAPEPEDLPALTVPKPVIPDEAFDMIAQVQWEDDVIWNGDEVKTKVIQSVKQKGPSAGWIPSSTVRTQSQFAQQGIVAYSHSNQ